MKLPLKTAQYRCGSCGYGISVRGTLPVCPMCQNKDWQPVQNARQIKIAGEAVKGAMLWFDEAKDFGFIRTDDGERLYVDRGGFVDRAAPVGRCAGLPVELKIGERDGKRIAVDVRLVTEATPRRARRRSSGTRITGT